MRHGIFFTRRGLVTRMSHGRARLFVLSTTCSPSKPMSPEQSVSDGEFRNPELYVNRELSWLAFNERVLDQAKDASWPLLERLKFLAIFGSNLDEFFMIRVSGLHEQLESRVPSAAPDGLSVVEQLAQIRERVLALTAGASRLLREELAVELEQAGTRILVWKQLSRAQR